MDVDYDNHYDDVDHADGDDGYVHEDNGDDSDHFK